VFIVFTVNYLLDKGKHSKTSSE